MLNNKSKNILNPDNDPGFGYAYYRQNERLVNKNGNFNVYRKGLSVLEKVHAFKYLMFISWGKFVFFVFLTFFIINALFAISYTVLGVDNLGINRESLSEDFLQAFYFSSQTITTLGYGRLNPVSHISSILASIESILGFMFFAMVTGLLYGRFSRPRIKLRFSENALVSPYRDGKAVMFRIANAREEPFVEVEANCFLTYLKNEKRVFKPLKLERNSVTLMALNWTIVHPLDNESPFLELSENELLKNPFEIIVTIKGFDETYGQYLYTRSSYTNTEVVNNAKFKSMVESAKEINSPVLNMDKLNSYENI